MRSECVKLVLVSFTLINTHCQHLVLSMFGGGGGGGGTCAL